MIIDRPFLTIVVPVYNVEKYIGSLLACLFDQTNSNFEIIFVDDGSTDRSLEIVRQNLPTIRKKVSAKLVKQKNEGLSSARNSGAAVATGTYIFFLDSDDVIAENFVEMINYFCDYYDNPDTLIFDYESINEFGENIESFYGHGDIYQKKDLLNNDEVLLSLSKDEVPTTAWSFVTKRSIIVKNDISFSIGKKFEDTNYTPKVFYFSEGIAPIDLPLYKYRQRPGSIMTENISDYESDAVFVIEDLFAFYKLHPKKSLGAVVGRSVITTLSSFLNSKIIFNALQPIRNSVKSDYLDAENVYIKRLKMYIFKNYFGYKIYSLLKR